MALYGFDRCKSKAEITAESIGIPVNNNILINSNFANPVNQRGITSLSLNEKGSYFIDRWRGLGNSGTTIDVVENGIKINANSESNYGIIMQLVEFPEQYAGKAVTLSVCVNDVVHSCTVTLPTAINGYTFDSDFFSDNTKFSLTATLNGSKGNYLSFEIVVKNAINIINWAKLEIGDHATPYVPRLYAEELALCERYYRLLATERISAYMINGGNYIKSIPIDMRIAPTVTANVSRSDGVSAGGVATWASYKTLQIIITKNSSNGMIDVNANFILDAEL